MKRKSPRLVLAVAVLAFLAALLFVRQVGSASGVSHAPSLDAATSEPAVIDTIKLGLGGIAPHGVAVNPTTHRVYVTTDLGYVGGCCVFPVGSGQLFVVDGTDLTVLTTIPDLDHPGEVAVNPTTNRVYVQLYDGVAVIDGDTNALVGSIVPADHAVGVALNASTNRIYTVIGTSAHAVEVMDGQTNSIVATIPFGGGAEYPIDIAVNEATNRIYVSSTNDLFVIDGLTNSVAATIPMQYPGHIAVNPATNRIYVAAGDSLAIIDGATNTLLSTVSPGPSLYDLALDSATNRLYITPFGFGSGSGSLVVMDASTNTLVANVPVGDGPVGVAVDAASTRIYVTNYSGGSLSVVNGFTNSTAATLPLGNAPYAVAVNPASNRVYVANWSSDSVSVIDGATDAIIHTIHVGVAPAAIAVNPTNSRIYVANATSDSVSVIDAVTDSVLTTVSLACESWFGTCSPIGIAVNSATGRVYTANVRGESVSVVDALTNTLVTTLPIPASEYATAVAVNTATNRAYVSTEQGSLFVIDGSTNSVTDRVSVGDVPTGVAINQATDRIFVTNNFWTSDSLSAIDGTTNTVVATLPVGWGPYGVSVNPLTNRAFVANFYSNTVSVIDGSADTVATTLPVGTKPTGVAVNPNTNRIYVANPGDDTVSVIQDTASPVVTPTPVPTPEPFTYIATGDSIPSGADLSASLAYPAVLDTHLSSGLPGPVDVSFENKACSGTTTYQYQSSLVCHQTKSQLNYLLSLATAAHKPDLITVTVGADDYVLDVLYNQCLRDKLFKGGLSAAATCTDQALRNENARCRTGPRAPTCYSLSAIGDRLKDTLSKLTATYPNAIIAVTDYYNPMPLHIDANGCAALVPALPPPWGALAALYCRSSIVAPINRALANTNSLLVDLNLKIASTVVPFTSSTNGRVVLADLYSQFGGHCGTGLTLTFSVSVMRKSYSVPLTAGCQLPQSWIQPLYSASAQLRYGLLTVSLTGQGGVHPNQTGHQHIADVIWNDINAKLGSP